MGLLTADLRALANLPREAIGRRLLVHLAVGLGILGMLSWWIASSLLARPELLALAHRQSGGNSQASLVAMGLIPCPMAATWLGLSLAQRQLFETPELGLWQSAPIAPWRGAVQILLRSSFMAVVWAAALAVPFLATLLLHWRAPALAWLALPSAIVTATVPLIATLLVVQIALVRLFAGRILRLVLTTLGAAASVAFSTWLLVILFSGSEGGGQLRLCLWARSTVNARRGHVIDRQLVGRQDRTTQRVQPQAPARGLFGEAPHDHSTRPACEGRRESCVGEGRLYQHGHVDRT